MMPRFNPDQRVSQVPRLAFRVWGGRGVLINPPRQESHVLSGVGAAIWEKLKSPVRVGDLAAAIATEYEVSPEAASADCDAFLGDLLDRGLIRVAEGS